MAIELTQAEWQDFCRLLDQLSESMNQRAALQLRLQKTVEGLSVVAISYYALGLAAAIVAPWAKLIGFDKAMTTGALAIPVIAGVWFALWRAKKAWDS